MTSHIMMRDFEDTMAGKDRGESGLVKEEKINEEKQKDECVKGGQVRPNGQGYLAAKMTTHQQTLDRYKQTDGHWQSRGHIGGDEGYREDKTEGEAERGGETERCGGQFDQTRALKTTDLGLENSLVTSWFLFIPFD
ncbi:hypothetical protein ElyMa_001199300 [Elysia marginata]|uniref:Uncharacterized protein n=1 Tax=Elysia marginata TaxID=1093978 RepID=A0AAV4I9Q7_9GAST|nr:hypothetical protein ElyMa_001199300 [Elysia marginata]